MGGGACHAIACRQALSCTKDRVITPVRVGVLRSLCPQIDADCHCNPMCVFGWFVWLGAREATLPRPPPPQPARCVYLGVVLPSQWYRPNTLFAAQTIATNRRQVV